MGQLADGVRIEGGLGDVHQGIDHILAQLALRDHVEVQGKEGFLIHQVGVGGVDEELEFVPLVRMASVAVVSAL